MAGLWGWRGRAGTTSVGMACGLAVVLVGCSSASVDSEPAAAAQRFSCVDDSRQCIAERAIALKTLLADKERRWVRETASPHAYASGVRMFAFKSRKKDLTCDELAAGRREADGASPSLRGAAGKGLSPAQISRGAMFAAEVGKELASEQQRRCKA